MLQPEFLNGQFGDPSLYLSQLNGDRSFLLDCGDLSKFSTKKLLRVKAIFLSHCHMDHFFGFDSFIRSHIGTDKIVQVFGPPDTSSRVAGKLQSYTWNLIEGDNT